MSEARPQPIAGGAGGATEAARLATLPRDATAMGPIARLLEDERVLGFLLLVPTVVLLGLFIAYPFVKGVWLSLTSATVGNPGQFLGLSNYVKIWNDSIFQRAAYNTFVYTAIATVGKLTLGMWLALLLNRHFRGKRLVRASMLLPFIVPTVLSTFAWKWMFDPTFSVLNWTLYHFGFIQTRIGWLTDPVMALGSVIVVNIWRGMPFYAITLLAGHFQLVYVLTGGGPANATHLFATYAYQIGINTGLLGEGAAVSLAMFPILFIIVVIQLWYIRRVEGA